MEECNALIVDDSVVMRKIVERALRISGIPLNRVYGAGNGEEGLRVLEGHSVELIMSDISMPRMDGIEFVRAVREKKLAENVPIIMVTTESSEEYVKSAIAAGAQGYLKKPFTPDQVRSHVMPLLPHGVA